MADIITILAFRYSSRVVVVDLLACATQGADAACVEPRVLKRLIIDTMEYAARKNVGQARPTDPMN